MRHATETRNLPPSAAAGTPSALSAFQAVGGGLYLEGLTMGRQNSFEAVARAHQVKIARRTLRCSDIGALILGGMTKEEAREVLRRATVRQ